MKKNKDLEDWERGFLSFPEFYFKDLPNEFIINLKRAIIDSDID